MAWLNLNAMVIQTIFIVISSVATVYYVYVSLGMLKEMKISRKKEEEPNVNINLIRISATTYDIEIRNISNVEVFDLEFIDPPDKNIFADFNIKSIGFIKNGIPYMGVNQVYQSFLIHTISKKNKEGMINGEEIKFELKYYDKSRTDLSRNVFTKKLIFNLNVLANTGVQTPFEDRLLNSLDNINNNFTELNKNLEKINLLTDNNSEEN